ncbi:MAG: hypothetical protein NTZ43_09940 [Gemmatimonadetes bacterium]|nr:hypothetical protein [Gemmatimonadota bacterium]
MPTFAPSGAPVGGGAPFSAMPGSGADSQRMDGTLPSATHARFAGLLARVLKPNANAESDNVSSDGTILPPSEGSVMTVSSDNAQMPVDASSQSSSGDGTVQSDANVSTADAASSSAALVDENAGAVTPRHAATDALRELIARVAGDSDAKAADAKAADAKAADAAAATATALTTDAKAASADASTAAPTDASSTDLTGAATNAAGASPLDASRALAAVDPTLIVRDVSSLQPEFRAKVERVIERMKDEFGHDVTVNEAWRSQTRQDYLAEQGRTRPGPVVTWTRASQHSAGAAADLVVDGKWDNAAGYQHLAQVAQEEGLQTLGPRDPGHVQLPGGRSVSDIGKFATVTDVQIAATVNPAADTATNARAVASLTQELPASAAALNVARVARVAAVAAVAGVARAANVAATGTPGSAAPSSATPGSATQVTSDTLVTVGGTRNDASTRGDRERSAPDRQGAAVRSASDASTSPTDSREPRTPEARLADLRSIGSEMTRALVTPTEGSGLVGTSAASRVDQVLALQDARDAQPASFMTLKMDNGEGGEDRIRVGVRGSTVGATIDVRDAATAEQINNRIQELSSALEARGLSTDALRVRASALIAGSSAPDSARGLAASGAAALARPGTLFAETSSSSRSRGDAQGQRSQQDPSRNRSRREQKGDTP